MNAVIPVEEFDRLCMYIRQGLSKPDNRAAMHLAKVSLSTLEEYSPTLIEATRRFLEETEHQKG